MLSSQSWRPRFRGYPGVHLTCHARSPCPAEVKGGREVTNPSRASPPGDHHDASGASKSPGGGRPCSLRAMTLTSLTFAIVLGLDPASAAAPKGKGNGPSFG